MNSIAPSEYREDSPEMEAEEGEILVKSNSH